MDPLQLGRLKVRISIYEDIATEQLPWCRPKLIPFLGLSLGSIMFAVPEIGSEVTVFFPDHDLYNPAYDSASLNSGNKCSFFDDDYPNSYGFKDSIGNFFKINKTKKTMQVQHSSTTNFFIEENGSFTATMSDGTTIHADTTNGKVKIDCVHFEVNASKTASIISNSILLDGQVEITSGATGIISGIDGSTVTLSNGVVTNINRG